MEIDERLEKIHKLLKQLEGSWVLVEGKRDRDALVLLGLERKRILTISGNLKISCGVLVKDKPNKAYILTDLDRRGNQLAKMAVDELAANSIRGDVEVRMNMAHLLRIGNFEDAKRAYDRLLEEKEVQRI